MKKSILAVFFALLNWGLLLDVNAQIGVSSNGREGGVWASYQGGVWSPFNFVNEYGRLVPWPRLTRYGQRLCYAPLVQTDSVYLVSGTEARVAGFIWHDGWGTISERGFYVSKNNVFTLDTVRIRHFSPTFYPWDACTPPCSLNVYGDTLTGLQPGTTYYVRAYAVNPCGTGYGDTLSFITDLGLRLSLTDAGCFSVELGVSATGGPLVSGTFYAYRNPDFSDVPIAASSTVSMNDSLLVTWDNTLARNTTYYVDADVVNAGGLHFHATIAVSTVDPTPSPVTTCVANTLNAGTSLVGGRWANREWSSDTVAPFHLDSVSDHEGNVYHVVQMGTKCWLKENVRVTTSPRQGTGAGQVNLTNPGLSTYSVTEPYYYTGDAAYTDLYGYVYNWCAVNDTMGTIPTGTLPLRRGLCPLGWHVPSIDELAAAVLNNPTVELSGGCMWTDMLGEPYAGYLEAANFNATGFSVLPTGFYNPGSLSIFASGFNTAFWTRTSTNSNTQADDYGWSNDYPIATINKVPTRAWGFPLRCLRDEWISLSNLMVDTIACTTADIHTKVLVGTPVSATYCASKLPDFSDCGGATSISGTATISGDSIYANITGLDCYSRYYFNITVVFSDDTATVMTTDSTLDHTRDLFTSCKVGLLQEGDTLLNGKIANMEWGVYDSLALVYELDSVSDHEGNVYKVVQIGTQCWLRENMRAATTPNQGAMTQVATPGVTQTTSVGPTCFANTARDANYVAKYGYLYNWIAAMDTTAYANNHKITPEYPRRGICPLGWHVPEKEEWVKMGNYIIKNDVYGLNYVSVTTALGTAGSYCATNTEIANLLSAGCEWRTSTVAKSPGLPNQYQNVTLFSALPVGYYSGTTYQAIGDNVGFWSATNAATNTAVYQRLNYNQKGLYFNNGNKYMQAYAVRCIRDVMKLKLKENVVDSVNCTYAVVHNKLLYGTASAYEIKAYTDDTYETEAGASDVQISFKADSIYALIGNLEGNTTYYIRTIASNDANADTAYNTIRTQCVCMVNRALAEGTLVDSKWRNHEWGTYDPIGQIWNVDSVSDHEGNVYGVLQIGPQCWLRSNLMLTTSPTTGESMLYGISENEGAAAYTRQARWFAGDQAKWGFTGPVYTWCAIVDYESGTTSVDVPEWYANRKGICPQGWHSFMRLEFDDVFATSCGGKDEVVVRMSGGPVGTETRWTYAAGNGYPGSVNDARRNSTGFTALPSGQWRPSNHYMYTTSFHFTSADQNTAGTFKYYWLKDNDTKIEMNVDSKSDSHSARCIRDGNIVLSDIVVDTITCTSVKFHALVADGEIDWSKTKAYANSLGSGVPLYVSAVDAAKYKLHYNKCGASASNEFIKDNIEGTITHSNDTIYGEVTGLACNTRYSFYIKVYDEIWQSYGIHISDSTRDESLIKETTCAVSAKYAANEHGTATEIDSVYDHQGNAYSVVQIGSQCWMKENMRATTSPTTGTYLIKPTSYTYSGKIARWYNNDSIVANSNHYGVLYNWNAAVDVYNTDYTETSVQTASGKHVDVTYNAPHRGICPVGWHLPTHDEWNIMESNFTTLDVTPTGERGTYAAMLVAGCTWSSTTTANAAGNYNAEYRTSSNFTALPAAYYNNSNTLQNVDKSARFWSVSQDASTKSKASSRHIVYDKASVNSSILEKSFALSVRCVRDVEVSISGITGTAIECDRADVSARMAAGIVGTEVAVEAHLASDASDPALFTAVATIATDSTLSATLLDLPSDTTIYVKIVDAIGSFRTQRCACHVVSGKQKTNEYGRGDKLYTVSDVDGNAYQVVQIGNQCWTRQNLRTTHTKGGTDIVNSSYYSSISKSAKWYANDSTNYWRYGLLYNFCSAADTTNLPATPEIPTGNSTTAWAHDERVRQGICPNGWHLPSDAEWTIMETYVTSDDHYGVSASATPAYGAANTTTFPSTATSPEEGRNTPIAPMLATKTGWTAHTTVNAAGYAYAYRDTTHFSALPAGYFVNKLTNDNSLEKYAAFWTSTPNGNNVRARQLRYNGAGVARLSLAKSFSLSVRCVRDVEVSISGITGSAIECDRADVTARMATGIVGTEVEVEAHLASDASDPALFTTVATITTDSSISATLLDLPSDTTIYVKIVDAIGSFKTQRCACHVVSGSQKANEYGRGDNLYTVSDVDGNAYQVVQIGNQCWTRENLRTTHTKGGTDIVNTSFYSSISKSAKWYANDSTNYWRYGLLYNFCSAADTTDLPETPEIPAGNSTTAWAYEERFMQGICPNGWHLPSDEEWTTMETYVTSDDHYGVSASATPAYGSANTTTFPSTATGVEEGRNTPIAPMLATKTGWTAHTTVNTAGYAYAYRDTTHFSVLPAGYFVNKLTNDTSLEKYAAFWTSTPNGTNVRARQLRYNGAGVARLSLAKSYSLSVRCVRDDE